MSDATAARNLIEVGFPVGPGRNIKAALGECFAALSRLEKRLPKDVRSDRPRQWTQRRVEAIWGHEARRIDHYEIEDLTAVAVEEARIERQRLRARDERLAAFLAAQDEGEAQQMDQRFRRMAGRLDHTRDGGAVDPADHDQSQSWG